MKHPKFLIIYLFSALLLVACSDDESNDEPENDSQEITTETGQTVKINNESWLLNNSSSLTSYTSQYYNSSILTIHIVKQEDSLCPNFQLYGHTTDKLLTPQNLTIGEELKFDTMTGYYYVNSATSYHTETITSGSITYAGYNATENTVSIKFNNATFIFNSTNKITVNGTIKIKYEYSEL